jgi:CheY-like chemotaxis protein
MPDRSRVVALVDDLMFVSRITEAAAPQGLEVKKVRTVAELVEACRPAPRVVLVDLDSSRLPWAEGVAALRADPELAGVPVVGFYGHVHTEHARQGEQAGCTRVLARGAFVQQLGRILELPNAPG